MLHANSDLDRCNSTLPTSLLTIQIREKGSRSTLNLTRRLLEGNTFHGKHSKTFRTSDASFHTNMNGKMIRFADGENSYDGYLSPAVSGRGPGLIVIQEWWGLVPHIKDVADRFAAEGFTSLAPDLYLGKTATEPDEAGSLMMALHIGQTERILGRAIDALLADPSVEPKKVGVVGFCMGGQLSLFAACTNPTINACVDFYGIHPNVQPALRDLNCPVLGIFAEHDSYASPEQVNALHEELTLLGKLHEFITLPGTNHAFYNDTGKAYDKEAADGAWSKVIEFFKSQLGS